MSENFGNELDSELEDEFDDDEDDDSDGDEFNRIPAATAHEVLTYVASRIVDDPESVHVEAQARGKQVTLKLNVAPDDLGRVIGRRGRVAQSIRTVVRAAGARDGVDASVDIVD